MYVQYGFLYLITDQAKITSAKTPDPYTAGVRYNNAMTTFSSTGCRPVWFRKGWRTPMIYIKTR